MRLIDADKLILHFNDWWYSSFSDEETEQSLTIKEAIKGIEEQPTVNIPDIVRCKDCKYFARLENVTHEDGCPVYDCSLVDGDWQDNPNDYCSHGERER